MGIRVKELSGSPYPRTKSPLSHSEVQLSKVHFTLCFVTRKEREEDDSELASIEQNNVVTITFQWIPDNAPIYWDRPIPQAPNGKPQIIGKRGKSAGLADSLRHFSAFVGLEGQS
jgi:hypothetical protein